MKLFIRPIVLSVLSTGIWIVLKILGLDQYIEGDEGAMASGTIAFLGIIYALLTAFTTATVWSQWLAVKKAVETYKAAKKAGDETAMAQAHQKFILNKDKRIPGTLKLILLMFSIFAVLGFYLLYFRNPLPGGFAIFTATMAASGLWGLIMDLDDPFTGVWNVEVPEEWKEEN